MSTKVTLAHMVEFENYIDAIHDDLDRKIKETAELEMQHYTLASTLMESYAHDADSCQASIARLRQDVDNLSRQVQELRELRDRDADYILQQQNVQHRMILDILRKIDAPAGMYR